MTHFEMTRRGFMQMGRLGWAKPNCRVLKDRTTGTEYMVSHDSSGPSVSLETPVPRRCTSRPEEPVVETGVGRVRFFVDGGTLQWEEVEDPASPRIWLSADLWTVKFSEPKVTFRVDVDPIAGTGEPLLIVESGEELLIVEGGETLDVREGSVAINTIVLDRLDLAQ